MFSTKGVQDNNAKKKKKDNNAPEKPVRPFYPYFLSPEWYILCTVFFKILGLMLYSRYTEHTHTHGQKRKNSGNSK